MTNRQHIVRAALAVASFGAIAAGCWMWFPPMGLIVPGVIVFGSLTYSHLTGSHEIKDADKQIETDA